MNTDVDHTIAEARRMSMCNFRVRFSQVSRGPHAYSAAIHIDEEYYGYITRHHDGPYVAFTARNRVISSASNLRELRESVIGHYASQIIA